MSAKKLTKWDQFTRKVSRLPALAAAAAVGEDAVHAGDSQSIEAHVELLTELMTRGAVRSWGLQRWCKPGTSLDAAARLADQGLLRCKLLLAGAEGEYVKRRTQSQAAAGLISIWMKLSEQTRREVAAMSSEVLDGALAICFNGGPAGREAAACAMPRFTDPILWSRLGEAMADPDALVQARGIDSLGRICEQRPRARARALLVQLCYGVLQSGPASAPSKRAAAMGLFTMRCQPPVTDISEGAISIIQSTLRFGSGASVCGAAVHWLIDPRMARAAEACMARTERAEERAAVLERWHLMLRPRRASAVASLKGTASREYNITLKTKARGRPVIGGRGPLPPGGLGSLRSVPASIGLLGLVGGLSGPSREHLLTLTLGNGDRAVRTLAMTKAPIRLLADFAFDADPGIAAGAAARWLETQPRRDRGSGSAADRKPAVAGDDETYITMDALARSPHQRVRALTAARGSGLSRVSVSTEAMNAAQLLRYVEDLKLEATAAARAAAALTGAIRCAGAVEAKLLRRGALMVLRKSIEAGRDERVVANLVEACTSRMVLAEGSGGEVVSLLSELKNPAYHQRVRANALRALGRSDANGAIQGLSHMLSDPRPVHRLSAAWLATRSAGLWVASGDEAAVRECKLQLTHLSGFLRPGVHEPGDAVPRAEGDYPQGQRLRARASHAAVLWSLLGGEVKSLPRLSLAGTAFSDDNLEVRDARDAA